MNMIELDPLVKTRSAEAHHDRERFAELLDRLDPVSLHRLARICFRMKRKISEEKEATL